MASSITRRRWPMRRVATSNLLLKSMANCALAFPACRSFLHWVMRRSSSLPLQWLLSSDQAGPIRTEFSYVTGGLTWEADYNIVAPDKGDVVDLVGWVTMDNQSGKTFDNARIKLMAGDVSKIQPRQMYDLEVSSSAVNGMAAT